MADALAVVDMLDAIGANAGRIPAGTKRVAIYLTGGNGIAWTNGDVATLTRDDPQLQTLLRIDQSNTTALASLSVYVIKDIESGASNVGTAVQEAQQRRARGLRTGFYFSVSDMATVQAAIAAVPGLADFIDFWVADWNLDRTGAIGFMETHPEVKAVQYSNGPFYDLSVTRADWPMALPAPKPVAKPKRSQALLTAVEEGQGAQWSIEGVKNPGDVALVTGSLVWHLDVSYRDGRWGASPAPATKAGRKLGPLTIPAMHPKVAAGASVGALLTTAEGVLHAFGVKIPLTGTEQAAIVAALPVVAAWFKKA